MKPRKNTDSADAALTLRNATWAFPYIAVMGLIWGYLAGGSTGALIGLMAAVAVSALIGTATTSLAGNVGGGAVNTLYGLGRRTIGNRERAAGDLNVVRYHKQCNRYDEALVKIEAVLAKDPEFPEALLLKAQILWSGFKDREGAKECLFKIAAVEPNPKAVFHRWALSFYQELSEEESG